MNLGRMHLLRHRRMRTALAVAVLGGLTAAGIVAVSAASDADANVQVVKVVAKRFSYTPSTITLKKGVPAVLEISSVDFTHGFNVPDLNLRADLPPGKVTKLKIMPDRVGKFEFLCDNFCGSGHEEMNGEIVVVE